MKLKLTLILENDETGEILARQESLGWSVSRRGMFESAEENLGKLERLLENKIKEKEAEEYMEEIADQQIKVSGHVR